MIVQIRPVPETPADIPALLAPESSLGPHGRLKLLARWVGDIRLSVCDPRRTRDDLPGAVDELCRLIRMVACETARVSGEVSSMPGTRGMSADLASRRCIAAGEDCAAAEMFAQDAGRCAESRQARMVTRMHVDASLRMVRRALGHLRAALVFEGTDS